MNPYIRKTAKRWEIGQMVWKNGRRIHGKPEKTFPLEKEAEARAYFDSLPKGTPSFRVRTPPPFPAATDPQDKHMPAIVKLAALMLLLLVQRITGIRFRRLQQRRKRNPAGTAPHLPPQGTQP